MQKEEFNLEQAIEELDRRIEELNLIAHELTDEEQLKLYTHNRMFIVDEHYKHLFMLLQTTYVNVKARARDDRTEFKAFTIATMALSELFYQQP